MIIGELRRIRLVRLVLLTFFAAGLMSPACANGTFVQLTTDPLHGSPPTGVSEQGSGVAITPDGQTAVVGAHYYEPDGTGGTYRIGAAFVFTRHGNSWVQQGARLSGSNPVVTSEQGYSVAISDDGNTVALGGPYDDYNHNFLGAVWIFTRTNGVWSQQGPKLVVGGQEGACYPSGCLFGNSVALSGDGNTLLVGVPGGNLEQGSSFVFTRSNGVWTQQGPKLVADANSPDCSPYCYQGVSVALSQDGNTALIGASSYKSNSGAAFVFTRSGTSWSQAATLAGTGAVGNAAQGYSVGLSADGQSAVLWGPGDNNQTGAAWIFKNSGGGWTQQGAKLVGTGVVPATSQYDGGAVAISGDGNTLMIGRPFDDPKPYGNLKYGIGATWVFTRNGGAWTQQGNKLIGTGFFNFTAPTRQGVSLALDATGRTALVGGVGYDTFQGAAWVFGAPVAPHDYDGGGYSDILWRANTGDVAVWLMIGTALQSGSGVGAIDPNWQIVKVPTGTSDFDGDGKADILWRHTNGSIAIWLMNGATVASGAGLGALDSAWKIAGVGDFDGDGKADILWRHSTGTYAIWFMNGTSIASSAGVAAADPSWQVAAINDLNGDGKADIVLRNTTTGDVAVWLMNGATIASGGGLGVLPAAWQIVGTGDFDGDGKADLLWRHSTGALAMWFMNGAGISSSAGVGAIDTAWNVASTGDYDGNGKSDIIWHSSAGDVAIWLMNGANIVSGQGLGVLPAAWSIVE